MFNKITLAAMVMIAAMLIGSESQAEAQNCYRGGGGFGYSSFSPGYGSVRTVSRYNSFAPRAVYGSSYRGGFGSFGVGSFGPSFGYGGFGGYGGYRGGYGVPFYGGRGSSFGRGGLSIGIGF